MTDRSIRSICVVGDGVVGRSAALAFRRSLPRAKITILALDHDPLAVADVMSATLPSVGRFHAAIGLNELQLVQAGIAEHHLGTHLGGSVPWLWSFGEVGRGEGAVPFHQLWACAHREGRALPFDRYSSSSVMAAAGKFVHPSADPDSPLATYLYGLHINSTPYRALLDQSAEGIDRLTGEVLSIARDESGRVTTLYAGADERIEADLYLDCSGPTARLHRLVDPAFEDWSEWIAPAPFKVFARETPAPTPLDHVDPTPFGWRITSSTSLMTLGEDGPTLRPGRRIKPFNHNVLALGDAAISLDPLLGANLSLAHSMILRAIDLLPGRNMHPLEAAEYNRRTAQEHSRVRDARILFEPSLKNVPKTLAITLEQWRARGRLPFFEEETFTPSSWAQMLIGRNILPQAVSPSALEVDPDAAASAMADYAERLKDLVAGMPAYPAYLAHIRR